MTDFTKNVIDLLNNTPKTTKRFTTGQVRKISAKVYKDISYLDFEDILDLCEDLLEQRDWALGIIAYDIAFRQRINYQLSTFDRFEKWLIEYVRDWSDCDDFCTHAFGALIAQHNELFERVIAWCDSPHFWVRRGGPVVLIYPIHKNKLGNIDAFLLVDKLIKDEHYLVQKGFGWMLKELSMNQEEKVIDYLKLNVHEMTRLAFRYSLEKMSKDIKSEMMKL